MSVRNPIGRFFIPLLALYACGSDINPRSSDDLQDGAEVASDACAFTVNHIAPSPPSPVTVGNMLVSEDVSRPPERIAPQEQIEIAFSLQVADQKCGDILVHALMFYVQHDVPRGRPELVWLDEVIGSGIPSQLYIMIPEGGRNLRTPSEPTRSVAPGSNELHYSFHDGILPDRDPIANAPTILVAAGKPVRLRFTWRGRGYAPPDTPITVGFSTIIWEDLGSGQVIVQGGFTYGVNARVLLE